jgi:hypothetical protein
VYVALFDQEVVDDNDLGYWMLVIVDIVKVTRRLTPQIGAMKML